MFSYKCKPIGLGLLIIGSCLALFYSFQKIDLSAPVFALYSSYINTHYFTVINNNIFEELIILAYLTGFILTSFSKEKLNTELYQKIRGEAWQNAILMNSALFVFVTIFIYGKGFMMFLIFNLFSVFVFFHYFYWIKKRKLTRKI